MLLSSSSRADKNQRALEAPSRQFVSSMCFDSSYRTTKLALSPSTIDQIDVLIGLWFLVGSWSGVIYSWNSAVVDRVGSMDSRFLAFFLVGDTMVPSETNSQIVSYLNWCADVLLSGIFPHRDYLGRLWPAHSWRRLVAGTALAGGYGGAFVATTHDAKARKDTHEFACWYNCNEICETCPATAIVPSLNYGNFRSDARWRRYIYTHASYVENAHTPTPWLGMAGFELSRALFDWMHCIHLGVAKDFCAQLLFDLCRFGYAGRGCLADQLLALWTDYRQFCASNKIPYNKRKFSVKTLGLKSGQFPEMNSRTKAAHVRPIIAYLAHKTRAVLAERDAEKDPLGETRAWCAFGLADILCLLTEAGVFLTPEQVTRAQTSGRIFLFAWHTMAASVIRAGEFKYHPRRSKDRDVMHI